MERGLTVSFIALRAAKQLILVVESVYVRWGLERKYAYDRGGLGLEGGLEVPVTSLNVSKGLKV